MPTTIALIAHDAKKEEIASFAAQHAPLLSRYRLIATGTTGQRIQDVAGLTVERMLSGPMGGDAQIAAEVATGNVVAVIFLVDALYAQPHEPGLQVISRVCNVHNVLLATNLITAEAIANRLAQTLVAHLIYNPVSGQGNADQDLAFIRQMLEPHLHLKVFETTPEIDSGQLVKEAVEAKADIVIASGGDGTVSTVAGGLIGTGIPLALFPEEPPMPLPLRWGFRACYRFATPVR